MILYCGEALLCFGGKAQFMVRVNVEVWTYIAGCGFALEGEMPHNALAAN